MTGIITRVYVKTTASACVIEPKLINPSLIPEFFWPKTNTERRCIFTEQIEIY